MKIRTITYGITGKWDNLSVAEAEVQQAATALRQAQALFTANGYEVQTVRLSLPPFLRSLPPTERLAWLEVIGAACAATRLEFVSLGAYSSQDLSTPEIVNILATFPAFNLTTVIAEQSRVVMAGVQQAAAVIHVLAGVTADGLCNFRYAAAAHCPPGIPFFPASYQALSPDGRSTLALGLQMPGAVKSALEQSGPFIHQEPEKVSSEVTRQVVATASPVQELATRFCQEHNLEYTGIDVSPAPLAEDSIVAAFETSGITFGEPGTLALAATITRGLQATPSSIKTTGYNGLMLPVLEDRLLGERVEQGLVDISKLLTYSAVCGTGLDVVPLPGELPVSRLENLLFDVAALSARYNKALSARLFPVPGKQAGERTTFASPYLTNTVIMKI